MYTRTLYSPRNNNGKKQLKELGLTGLNSYKIDSNSLS